VHLAFEDTVTISAPVTVVWGHLMDPSFVATCAPGVAGVEEVGPTEYRAVSRLALGSLSFQFKMRITLTDLEPPSAASMQVHGTAPGSVLDAVSKVRLTALDAEHTDLTWTATAEVRGSIAGTGARLLKGTSGKLIEKFWVSFARKVEKAGR
jgi:carbon monoxide dehydrogenase subunit G